MSHNQSRAEKRESHYKKPGGRPGYSAHQRVSSGGAGKGGGGTGLPPASSNSHFSSYSTNSSFKKSHGQGAQSGVTVATANSESNAVQNGSRAQPSSAGAFNAPLSDVPVKSTDLSSQRSNRTVPRAPSSQSTSGASKPTTPSTPIKGNTSRGVSLQFGSFSPGIVNGMQIPARTSSAPPNLDEQKRDQARHDSFRSAAILPTSSISSQKQPREDIEQSKGRVSHPSLQAKRDVRTQVSATPVVTSKQNASTLPVSGASMAIPFQQSQVLMQFGIPSQQIQAQGVTATSLQLPIPLPVGNSSQVPQQVFVPSLQAHPLQPQGMMHQGQGMNFPPQIGHQLGSQLGNLGVLMNPQFAQQQAGKFGVPRKSVKITHPETHEELRLDKRADMNLDAGSPGAESHPNVPLQPQPVPYGPPHQMNYFPHIHPNPIFFQNPTSVPLTSTQMAPSSQASGLNYAGVQGSQILAFRNSSSVNPLSVAKTGPEIRVMAVSSNLEHAYSAEAGISAASSASAHVTVKPAVGSDGEKVVPTSVSNSSTVDDMGGVKELLRPPVEVSNFFPEISIQQSKTTTALTASVPSSLPIEHSVMPSADVSIGQLLPGNAATVAVNTDCRKRETVRSSDSIKDQMKKPSKKDQRHFQLQQQAETSYSGDRSTMKPSREVTKFSDNMVVPLREVESSTSIFMGPSLSLGHITSSDDGISETVECKATAALSENCGDFLVSTGESLPDAHAGVPVASVEGTDCVQVGEGPISETSNVSNVKTDFDNLNGFNNAKQDDFTLLDIQLKERITGLAEQQKTEMSEQPQLDNNYNDDNVNILADSVSLESSKVSDHTEDLNVTEAAFCNEIGTTETKENVLEGAAEGGSLKKDKAGNNLVSPTAPFSDSSDSNVGALDLISAKACGEAKVLTLEASKSGSGCMDGQEVSLLGSGVMHQDTSIQIPIISEAVLEIYEKVSEKANGDLVQVPSSGLRDKPTMEVNGVNSNPVKSKKKRKEFLQKADAAGTISDLYMAYKGPEENPQPSISSESVDSNSSIPVRPVSSSSNEEDVASKEDGKSKAEPDDWEDAADISTPEFEISDNREDVDGGLRHHEDGNGVTGKRTYSRDFLLTLSGQCTDLPAGFEIANDIVEVLMGSKASISKVVDRNPRPSSGRTIDRPSGVFRPDYRGSGIVDDDRWIKSPGPPASGQDQRIDIGQGGNYLGFRPSQGGNYGALRNLRGQTLGQNIGGFPSGPLLPLASPGGIQRSGPDAARWPTSFQRGLIPSPQSTLQVMHKAAKKYEVGKVSDVEEAKQRQLKAILNKLTPQNFDRLFEQVKEVNIDNAVTLTGVIAQIFDKALIEPTFCELYANFCCHLAGELPDFVEDNEKITFKRLLLNKCQEEFERGEREQAEADRVEGDGEVKQSKEEREEKRIRARRRMLGNIRLIGELYKKKMLTERIMHDCIQKLLGEYQNPDEEDIEALCKLMSTIGEMIDHPKAKEHMDAYFERIANLSNNMKLSSRVRFMLKDVIDLRKSKWQQRRKVEGPKKIEELHRDVAQERQAHNGRLARGSSIGSSSRRGQPLDFGPRASSILSSPNSQMGAFRGMPSQVRGFGSRDVRLEDRNPHENRTLSVPLPHRPIDDNTITLGPQGGLARGMSVRGQSMLSGAPMADISSGPVESRRMPAGLNGYSSASEWRSHNSRQEPMPRNVQERFMQLPAYDQSYSQEHSMYYANRDLPNAERSFDRSRPGSPATQLQRSSSVNSNVSSGKVWPEERLRDMSMAAIREFYSAKDENEVALCIRDLNSPSFCPSMISIWVNDSFERKDRDRDLLAGLLVNLTKSRDGILSRVQLIQGFESVLATLEDTVTDAPKAGEFFGRILARIIIENVISLKEIERLIQQGGEEPGYLLQIGLGNEVLKSAFETIRSEKGNLS
uniref:Eukaryotic translation initiation factor 4G n=1 Tax=Davidia involucrata TaxID=16924 RepID=A0A5B6Z427_DAVIN